MSLSAIDKIDKAAKSAYKTSLSDSLYGYNYGGYIPSGDLSRDEYGAAAAYAVIVEIFAAIAVWETYLDGVTWIVRDKSSGKEIGRTDVRDYPLNERGGKWIASIRRFEMNYHHSFWKSLAFSDWLYGNSYVVMLPAERQLHPNRQLWAGLKWLNPLNTSTQVMNGKIAYYSYSGMDNEELDAFRIPPEQMAYRINRRNAFDDNLGYSGVLAAMDAINLSRNAVRAFKNFFSNGMQLGGVISPVQGETWSNIEHEAARREWAENHKGASNAGRWAILRRKAEITPFGQEDASSNFTVTKDLRNTIYAALSVFPQLAGDPSDATYDNAKEVKRQWWQMLANPYAKDIAGYQTNVVIPKLEPDANVYIEPDLSPYEVEEPEIISQDVNAGIIDIATGQTKRGYPVDNELRGIYMIAGRPMSKDILLQVANSLPATEVQQYAQADKYQAETEQLASTPVESTTPLEAPITSDEMASLNIPTEDTSKHYHDNHEHTHDLPPLITVDTVSELDELAAWRKFVSNGKAQKRAFEQKALRGDIGDALQLAIESHDRQTILTAFKSAQERIETRIKAIQATRLDFENSVEDIMSKALDSNNYGRVQWSTAMRKIIRSACTRAYVDGLINGGVLDGVLSEEDQDTLSSHIASQSQYVTNLGAEIFNTENGISEAMADRKPSLWFNKSVMPMYDAGQLSANGNRMMEFAGDDGDESCPTCQRLKGQRHRHKDWARKGLRPDAVEDSDNFECGLWECKHHLIPVKAAASGNW